MKFNIKITKTLEGHVEIEAESAADAVRAAEELYNQGGAELPDMDDVSPLRFSIDPVKPIVFASPVNGEHFSREEIEFYFRTQGYPHPSNDQIEEFLHGGENQAMYDEAVRNGYSPFDLDRWFHLNKVIGEPISFRAAMFMDDALWEEEFDVLDVGSIESMLNTPEGICKARLEALIAEHNDNRSDLMNKWGLHETDIPRLAKAFHLPIQQTAEQKPSLSSLIESADNRQNSSAGTHYTQTPER